MPHTRSLLGALALAVPLVAQASVAELPDAVQAGQGRLSFLGLAVYEARLWVAPQFRRSAFDQHAFALELHYLRGFKARDIAERSLQEMQREGPIDAAQAERWKQALGQLLPDVRQGDRLTGVHRPGQGAEFFHNGKRIGLLADAEFARRFFGIWLSPATSAPQLRDALLAGTTP